MENPVLARRLLTEFLKSRRAKLSPDKLGFGNSSRRRRTQGLRRSEAAELAGVSEEWYTLLEMGQPRASTRNLVDAVCRAFELNDAERGYVHDLVFGASEAPSNRRLHPSIELAVQRIGDAGLIVSNEWLTVISCNTIARDILLIKDDDELPERNLLYRLFTDSKIRTLAGSQWMEHARRHVGLFRRALARDPGNPEARTIIDRLTGIPEFEELWKSQDVYSFEMYNEDSLEPLVLNHPVYGEIALRTVALEAPGWPGVHICCLTPAGDGSGFSTSSSV